jgi:hypothetical protein
LSSSSIQGSGKAIAKTHFSAAAERQACELFLELVVLELTLASSGDGSDGSGGGSGGSGGVVEQDGTDVHRLHGRPCHVLTEVENKNRTKKPESWLLVGGTSALVTCNCVLFCFAP